MLNILKLFKYCFRKSSLATLEIKPDRTLYPKILHIANWYPNQNNPVEGNFIRDHIHIFKKEYFSSAIAVQLRENPKIWFKLRVEHIDNETVGYYIHTRIRIDRAKEALSTLLLIYALFHSRFWRYDLLQFHIAIPLLIHFNHWKHIIRKKILITEHWTAYHYNFYLPENSKSLIRLRKPFQQELPVLAVSQALLNDIKLFSGGASFPGYVIPNVVPLLGPRDKLNNTPVLFTVNVWRLLKDPIPMLEGLALAKARGCQFKLVIGGYGEMIPEMERVVSRTDLYCCTEFRGRMTKSAIASQLQATDGFIFSSKYETFSVACAEALGAGVPLIGPLIPAVSEYSHTGNWQEVPERTPEAWANAILTFLKRISFGDFDAVKIASEAHSRFSESAIRSSYRRAIQETLSSLNQDKNKNKCV
jgi:glycosyltransferase involved in cell wall biosynthesis